MKIFWRAVVLFGIVTLLSTQSVSAATNGGFGGRPANPDPNNPRTQSIFIYTIDRGASKTDQVLVANNSDTALTIQLYAVDGVVSNTGAYTCKQESEAKTDIGGWIKFAQNQVTLKPRQEQKVGFTVTMPADADVGEHDACIVFQNDHDEGVVTGNVRIKTRQAIRLVATVPGALHRDITISNFDVSLDDKNIRTNLSLQNTGNVSADVDTRALVTTLFGNTLYGKDGEGGSYPIMPNQKLDLPLVIQHRPFFGGWYYVEAKISYDKRAGSFGTSDTSQLLTKSQKQLIFIAPSPFVQGLVALLTIGLGVWFALRLKRKKLEAEMGYHTAEKGETIESIARDYHMSWKRLARTNNISAPYTIKTGSKIKVPQVGSSQKD